MNLSPPALDAFGPAVAIDSSGGAQALWFGSEGFGEVVQASSRPLGGAWSSALVLPEEEGGMRPDISTAGATAVAVWQFDGETESRIESAVHSGSGWSTPVNVTDPGEESEYFPRVAANANGEAVAVWQHCYGSPGSEQINECFDGEGEYVVKASVRRGGTWSEPKTVSSESENAVKLQTAIDASGNAVVVWEDQAALEIRASKLTNPGTTWSTPDTLSDPAREAGEPQVAFDSAGNATAVWHSHIEEASNYRVANSVLPAGSTSWPEAEAPTTVYAPAGSNDAFEPQVALDGAGYAVAIWSLRGSVGDTVQGSVRSGGTWSPPADVSAGGQEVRAPRLAMDSSGDAVAIWRRSNGSNNIIQGAELPPGGSWSAAEDVSAGGQNAVEPDVAIDPMGNAAAIWRTNPSPQVAQASTLYALRLQSASIPGTGVAGTPIAFSASPVGIWGGVSTSWAFGDGAGGTGTAPSHTYAAAGTYTVTVTSTDARGNTASASGTIVVSAPPAEPPKANEKPKSNTEESGTAWAGRVIKVKGGKALVQLHCNKAGKCSGVVNLFAKVKTHVASRTSHRAQRPSSRSLRGQASATKMTKTFIGKKSFKLGKGKTYMLRVPLNRRGKRFLRTAKHHRFAGLLAGRGVKNRSILVKQIGG